MATFEEHKRQVKELIKELLILTKRKSGAYGGDDDIFRNMREFGWKGVVIRIDDKLNRLKNLIFAERKIDVGDEPLEETIIDLINYCLILNTLKKSKHGAMFDIGSKSCKCKSKCKSKCKKT